MALEWEGWTAPREVREERLAPEPLTRLAATLDHDRLHWPAGALPPLAHWLYFLPDTPTVTLGPDGHPTRGGLLPPIAAPRRMWAGSRIAFHQPLRIGELATRTSEVTAVTRKDGRSGALHFVTLHHEIAQRGAIAVREEQDIVYREAVTGAAPPTVTPHADTPEQHRALLPDAPLLFRFSALTFNAHRIHYDRDYAQREEGYGDLVVHGPLQAMLLVDLLLRERPGTTLASFTFRGQRPALAGRTLEVCMAGDDPVRLWTRDPDGAACMVAEARLA